jgi:dienelactone hydrolase
MGSTTDSPSQPVAYVHRCRGGALVIVVAGCGADAGTSPVYSRGRAATVIRCITASWRAWTEARRRMNTVKRGTNPTVAEILLFHHAQGQTLGFVAFADDLRAAGHTVHSPDLYEGKTFATLDAGVAYAKQVGFDTILERCRLAAERLPNELVYAGFSLGVMGAQMLAQTRVGAKGCLLFSAAFPASEFGGSWPPRVPLQIHMMDGDEWAMEDLPAARDLAETIERAELFLYPGDRHLFADNSLPDYDEGAATVLKQRVLGFLDNID